MTFFDALCHTFGTMATGGFSTKNLSIGYYDSNYIKWVITFFMIFSGVNFALYYSIYKLKNMSAFFKDEELRFFLSIIVTATLFVSMSLFNSGYQELSIEMVTDAAFQVVSVITTTGYATINYDLWPLAVKIMLLLLMFVGGCAGSTTGSVKAGRILILCKEMIRQLKMMHNPRVVSRIKISKKGLETKILINTMVFFFTFVMLTILSAVILSLDQVDFVTALTASAATLTNVGPGFGLVGPSENYAFFGNFSKIYMSFLMLLGRLELYTVLVLLNPVFWKK